MLAQTLKRGDQHQQPHLPTDPARVSVSWHSSANHAQSDPTSPAKLLVSTTRLTVALLLTAAFSTFLVPRSAGSTRSFLGSSTSLQPARELVAADLGSSGGLDASSLHAESRVNGGELALPLQLHLTAAQLSEGKVAGALDRPFAAAKSQQCHVDLG